MHMLNVILKLGTYDLQINHFTLFRATIVRKLKIKKTYNCIMHKNKKIKIYIF